ncbi:MAG TPA: sensor domain-containing diguanylate cyclase [Clostridia bacterium]|nr:sensor domain-containing diguanylate cyclase [Clostridia bacterium]
MGKYNHLYIEYSLIGIFLIISSAIMLIPQNMLPLGNSIWFRFGLFALAVLFALAYSFLYTRHLLEASDKKLSRSKREKDKLTANAQVQDRIIALTHELMDVQSTKNAFEKILEFAISSIDHAVAGSIMLANDDNKLSFAASKNYNHEALIDIKMDLEETFLWQKTGGKIKGPVIVNNSHDFSRSIVNPDVFEVFEKTIGLCFESTISSPLFIDGKLYGMINVDSTRKNAFDEGSLRLMNYFTIQAEFAIKNRNRIEHFYHLSRYDTLTNVYNRRYFRDIVEMDIQKSARYPITFLIALFDLDGLKRINDTYGHLAGDRCLSYFAGELKKLVRKQDILARFGGDEFIASFYVCDWKDLVVRIEEFREYFKEHPCRFDDVEIPLSFSYGLAEFPQDGETYTDLIKKADELMYVAKKEYKQLSFLNGNTDLPE